VTGPFSRQPQWLAGFDLPERPTGAIIALDISDAGLWAGRIVDGAVAASDVEARITPAVLDARISGYLRDTGLVEADSPEAFGELVGVVNRARRALVDQDSTLMMGEHHLRLVRLRLDDVVEATVPEVNRANGMIVELAGPLPVDAVLLGPGHDEWPGLWEALTERGFTSLLPGDAFPTTFGGDDAPTEYFAAPPSGPIETRAWTDSGANQALVDPSDYGLDRFGNAAPDVYAENAASDADDPDPPSGIRGRMIVIGVLLLAVLGGGSVAIAMNAHESNGPERTVEEETSTTQKPGSASEPERVHGSVDPKDLEAARAPVSSYTTPPPPPPPSETETPRQSEARPGPKPPEPTRPNRRTIPNPIPGLPPIVVG